jgi:hypothetical protein
MKLRKEFRIICALAPLVLVATLVAQSDLQTRTLVINGHSGKALVYRVDREWFIDLETLVRIANGSATFQGDQIILTLPGMVTKGGNDPAPPPTAETMTKDFMTVAVQDLALIKNWYTIMAHAIQRGVPGDGSQLVLFHDRAAEGLRLATVHASSSADRDALRLLTNHFNHVDHWKTKLVDARKSMSTANYSITPNALDSDREYQKIVSCDQSLATILSTGQNQPSDSCH